MFRYCNLANIIYRNPNQGSQYQKNIYLWTDHLNNHTQSLGIYLYSLHMEVPQFNSSFVSFFICLFSREARNLPVKTRESEQTFFCLYSGFDEHRRRRRFEVNSRPMFDSKKKTDEKREKVKQLLGKRKQMQFNSFSSPAKSSSELIKLGIKVRRNRFTNGEGSEDCSDKEQANKDLTAEDPTNKDSTTEDPTIKDHVIQACTIEDTATAHSTLGTNSADKPDVRILTVPEVSSRCEKYENPSSFPRKRKESGNEAEVDRLAKQRKDLNNSSLNSRVLENNKTGEHNGCSQDASGNFRVNSSSPVGFLVCCDYTDSSDASDTS